MNLKKGNMGPLVASIVIVIILLAVGAYSLKERPLKQEVAEPTDETVAALENQGSSSEILDIENDLNATKLDGIGGDLDTAEAEVE